MGALVVGAGALGAGVIGVAASCWDSPHAHAISGTAAARNHELRVDIARNVPAHIAHQFAKRSALRSGMHRMAVVLVLCVGCRTASDGAAAEDMPPASALTPVIPVITAAPMPIPTPERALVEAEPAVASPHPSAVAERATTRGALFYNPGRIAEGRGDRLAARRAYEQSLASRPGNEPSLRALAAVTEP